MTEKLKLPLDVTQVLAVISVQLCDADGCPVAIAQASNSGVALHRAEVCKAALEADAEEQARAGRGSQHRDGDWAVAADCEGGGKPVNPLPSPEPNGCPNEETEDDL